MDNPVKPLREHTIREGAHIAKKDATICPPLEWVGRGWIMAGSGMPSKVGKKRHLVAFAWLFATPRNESKCDPSHRNSVRRISDSAVKQMGVEGGGSENAKSGSKRGSGWIEVRRNKGVTSTSLGKSRRFCRLSGHVPPLRAA